ncbi:GSCFA domain-containing protein [Roseovarius salis]|uniref:GSCFA domain-containing protein n=1 Tax=Roseovarius salis TaxID=3376063 RepID=UPI0037CC0E86
MTGTSPYSDLEPAAFWRRAVAEPGIFGLSGLWRSCWVLPSDARFVTYGSCFAQHISRALVARGLNWLNAEPAPPGLPEAEARRFNYGIFSARTGNIYTARQLLHWARLAADPARAGQEEIWTEPEGRHRPALCPVIEPDGFASAAEAAAALEGTARAFRRSVVEADVFVFTLGLTEGWRNRQTGAPYAMCPGTIAGSFDAGQHVFENAGYPSVRADLEEAAGLLRGLNPALRVLLTVSPVPLTATASGSHVLPATVYSKSTLRAVAGDLAADMPEIDYFPSYEIIAAPPARAAFFAPNLRSVEPPGVSLVMSHFFAGLDLGGPARGGPPTRPADAADIDASLAEEDVVCEESSLGAAHDV